MGSISQPSSNPLAPLLTKSLQQLQWTPYIFGENVAVGNQTAKCVSGITHSPSAPGLILRLAEAEPPLPRAQYCTIPPTDSARQMVDTPLCIQLMLSASELVIAGNRG